MGQMRMYQVHRAEMRHMHFPVNILEDILAFRDT
jgi:hypothetical protein